MPNREVNLFYVIGKIPLFCKIGAYLFYKIGTPSVPILQNRYPVIFKMAIK
jgi:hypothetical protein